MRLMGENLSYKNKNKTSHILYSVISILTLTAFSNDDS